MGIEADRRVALVGAEPVARGVRATTSTSEPMGATRRGRAPTGMSSCSSARERRPSTRAGPPGMSCRASSAIPTSTSRRPTGCRWRARTSSPAPSEPDARATVAGSSRASGGCAQRCRSKRSSSMTLTQAATKSRDELLLRVVAGVDLGDAPAAAEFEPKTRSTAVAVHFTSPVRVADLVDVLGRLRRLPLRARREQVRRRSRSSACPGRSVSTPCVGPPTLAPSARSPPTSTVISGAVRLEQVGAVEQQRLGRQLLARRAGSCGTRRRAARAPRTSRRRSAPAWRRCGPGGTAR